MGFHVFGAGTETIFVKGAESIKTNNTARMYFLLEDRIEAVTYMCAVLGTGGRAVFRNIRPNILTEAIKTFERMGAQFRIFENMMEIWCNKSLKSPGIIVSAILKNFNFLTLENISKAIAPPITAP